MESSESESSAGRPPSTGAALLEPPISLTGTPPPATTTVADTTRLRRQRPSAPPPSARSRSFRRAFFPLATEHEWNDWRWQLRNRFRNAESLARIICLSEQEIDALVHAERRLPVAVTPYYASLLDPDDPGQPLRRSVVPVTGELVRSPGEADDPLAEDWMSPVCGLVHRYPDRVLFLVTDRCAVCCRYCTRSRMVGKGGIAPSMARWARALEYIERTPAIRDVLLSGGDVLTMSDARIEHLLRRLRAIRHVEMIRIGTKVPAALPQRITSGLTRMLRRYHPLWMSIHFTHPEELTPETASACERLADAGIPLGSQTVLLKGINDDVAVMKRLVQGLLRIRVRPYYLYQCDPITGSSHFRTLVQKGVEIIAGLRGYTTGYAVPQFVIDAPGGGGKIPLLPESVVGRDGEALRLRNYEGRVFTYPDVAG